MSTQQKRPLSRREKKALAAIVLISGLILFAPIWWRHRNAVPTIVVPEPKMPSPNAFTYFVNAGAQVKDRNILSYAISERTAEEIARLKSEGPKITGVGGPPGAPPKKSSFVDPNRYYSLKEKEQILKRNAAALKTVRQGLKLEYCHPPVRSFDYLYPYVSPWRAVGQLFVLEQQIHIAHGRPLRR